MCGKFKSACRTLERLSPITAACNELRFESCLPLHHHRRPLTNTVSVRFSTLCRVQISDYSTPPKPHIRLLGILAIFGTIYPPHYSHLSLTFSIVKHQMAPPLLLSKNRNTLRAVLAQFLRGGETGSSKRKIKSNPPVVVSTQFDPRPRSEWDPK